MEWNKYQKPPATVCPEKYCFHWVTLAEPPTCLAGHTPHFKIPLLTENLG